MGPDLVPAFLDALLRASWRATVLVAVMLLLQRLLRRWLTPRWRHALWLIVVARLLLPVAPASSWSLSNVTPALPARLIARARVTPPSPLPTKPPFTSRVLRQSAPKSPSAVPLPAHVELAIAPLAVGDSPVAEAAAGTEAGSRSRDQRAVTPASSLSRSDWHEVAFVLWASGVLLLSARLLRSWLRLRRRLRSARAFDEATWDHLLTDCRESLGVHRSLRVFEVEWVHSPALCGWWRPRLLLPAGLAEGLSRDKLRHVLLHELAHLKRHDILVNWIATVAQVLHWFNPVVWFALRRLRAERELAADHLALVALGEDGAQSYGETILRLMVGLARPAAVPAMVGILDDRGALRERIQAVAAFRCPGRSSGFAVVLVGFLAIVGLTNATEDHHGAPAPASFVEAPSDLTNTTANTSHFQEDPLWGTVYLDSQPLEGAWVTYYDHVRTMGGSGRTDAQGRIFVYPNSAAKKLVVWHAPFQAVLDATRLTNEFRIELGSERGRVTGTLWRGDQPWPAKELTLQRRWPGLIEPSYHPVNRTNQAFRIPAITDAQGRFEFRDVPCGVWVVRSRHVEWGELEVRPGAVVLAELGRGGAAIVGLVVSDDPTFRTDWRNVHVNLITKDRGPQPWLADEVESDEWYIVDQVLPAERVPAKWRWLPGEVEADGSFVVPEVPPGDGVLSIEFYSERATGADPFPVELGAGPRIRVSVPAEMHSRPRVISVGTIPIRMRPPAESAHPGKAMVEPKGTGEVVTITVEAQPPHLYLRNQPVTLEKLKAALGALTATNQDLPVAVRVQTNSPVGMFVEVMDAVKAAGFSKPASVFTAPPRE